MVESSLAWRSTSRSTRGRLWSDSIRFPSSTTRSSMRWNRPRLRRRVHPLDYTPSPPCRPIRRRRLPHFASRLSRPCHPSSPPLPSPRRRKYLRVLKTSISTRWPTHSSQRKIDSDCSPSLNPSSNGPGRTPPNPSSPLLSLPPPPCLESPRLTLSRLLRPALTRPRWRGTSTGEEEENWERTTEREVSEISRRRARGTRVRGVRENRGRSGMVWESSWMYVPSLFHLGIDTDSFDPQVLAGLGSFI